MDGERIVLGSGYLYVADFDGKSKQLPENAEIEKDENILGLISGGAEVVYKPSYYEAKDDMGKVSKTILTEEEATLKSGVMTWCGKTLEKLCETARVAEDKTKKVRKVKIGGVGNATGKKYVLHFVHKDETDGDSFAFAKDKETVIDTEFKAAPQDDEGTLIHYEEDMIVPEDTGGTEPIGL